MCDFTPSAGLTNICILLNFLRCSNRIVTNIPLFFLRSIDAFEDAGDNAGGNAEEKVHVRVQQRNGRKCITTVAGLADDLDIKRICKAFKKNFSCNGAVQKDEDAGEVIQLSGDQRTNVKAFLVDQEICHGENIVLHGF